jgi:hypothetical protein
MTHLSLPTKNMEECYALKINKLDYLLKYSSFLYHWKHLKYSKLIWLEMLLGIWALKKIASFLSLYYENEHRMMVILIKLANLLKQRKWVTRRMCWWLISLHHAITAPIIGPEISLEPVIVLDEEDPVVNEMITNSFPHGAYILAVHFERKYSYVLIIHL